MTSLVESSPPPAKRRRSTAKRETTGPSVDVAEATAGRMSGSPILPHDSPSTTPKRRRTTAPRATMGPSVDVALAPTAPTTTREPTAGSPLADEPTIVLDAEPSDTARQATVVLSEGHPGIDPTLSNLVGEPHGISPGAKRRGETAHVVSHPALGSSREGP